MNVLCCLCGKRPALAIVSRRGARHRTAMRDHDICRQCWDRLQRRFDAAKKMTIEEWSTEGFPESVFDPYGRAGNDGYCADFDDLRDYYLNDPDRVRPTWAWATIEVRGARPDASDVIESVVQNMHEEAYEDFDEADLQKKLDDWFEAQDVRSFMEEDGVAVLLGDDFWTLVGCCPGETSCQPERERCEMTPTTIEDPKLYTEAEAGAMVAEIAGLKAALCDRDEERTAWKAYAEALYVFGRKHQQATAARSRLVAIGEIEK